MRRAKSPDFVLFLAMVMLLGIGIVMVFSSSAVDASVNYGDKYYFLKRQALWALIGLGALLVAMKVDYWRIQPYTKAIFLISLLLLVVVLIPGVGITAHGARRWIDLGVVSFQPSELMKLAFVLYLANYLDRRQRIMGSFSRGVLPPLILLGIVFALILVEPDLGTAVAIAGMVFVMLFVGGAKVLHLFMVGLASLPAGAWMVLGEEYRRERFFAFLNPWADRLGSGFHIIQALYALGSGRLFGVGLGQSRQKLFYLPERHTDFIFAIIGEELGFVGCIFVLSLFFILAWRGYRIAVSAPDTFGCFLAAGITTMITLQVIINVGVVTSLLPITGITLPLISFGGSSLVPTMAGIGILMNISRYTKS